ncbi:MAG: arginase [Brumimicrobium sp.]|nr:arginase [Brumimicrobium sp.]
MRKSITLIINESEISAGTRGASLGPGALRVVDRQRENYIFGKYPNVFIQTENHLLDQPTKLQWGKHADGLATIYKRVAQEVKTQRAKNDFVFVLAADHGSAGGTIAGLKMENPGKKLGVLWIDAHGDLHTPYTTPSGNMHGMPLATALNEDNLESKQNDPQDETIRFWKEMKEVGNIAPKINAEDLAFIGLRDLEKQEVELMERKGLKNISVDDFRKKGAEHILQSLNKKFDTCDEIYVSFDVDSMDPDVVSHGTGTPVKNGLTPEEALLILKHFAAHSKVRCIEFVEVNPCLDEKANKMAETAYELMKEVLETVEKRD